MASAVMNAGEGCGREVPAVLAWLDKHSMVCCAVGVCSLIVGVGEDADAVIVNAPASKMCAGAFERDVAASPPLAPASGGDKWCKRSATQRPIHKRWISLFDCNRHVCIPDFQFALMRNIHFQSL